MCLNGTRHRWTGRYEAHLWDKSTWNQNQNKKGKQGLILSLPMCGCELVCMYATRIMRIPFCMFLI